MSMVAPITDLGSSTKTLTYTDAGHLITYYYSYRHRYRQRKPFTLILPYSGEYHQLQGEWRSHVAATLPFDASTIPFGDVNWTPVRNKSYEKLRAKVYDRVGAGVDFAEYKQSVGMIASTATSLFKAYKAVKSLRFGDAASALRMKFIPKGVSPFKSAANNWLEFHFGWQPLLGDIHDALQVINDPVKSFDYVRSRATDDFYWHQRVELGSVYSERGARGYLSCTQGCRVKFQVPGTTHTLDQWGVMNPFSIAWELVPYSFVVDWFVNVGDFIASKSDFAGMTLESTYNTLHYEIIAKGQNNTYPNYSPSWQSNSIVRYVTTARAASLSGIALEVKSLKPPSLVRAATAISLLLQIMR